MKVKQWLFVLFCAIILAFLIRVFAFETIRVTTDSMSQGQNVGDRLLVEKWSLGPRMPLSLGIPFASDNLFGYQAYMTLRSEVRRLRGFGSIHRNDILAFNAPVSKKEVLDRTPILLSRCAGLPGETIQLTEDKMLINGKKTPRHPDASFCFRFRNTDLNLLERGLQFMRLKRDIFHPDDSGYVYLTRHDLYKIKKNNPINKIQLESCHCPFEDTTIYIPRKGFTISLNDSTFKQWGKLINRFEHVKLVKKGSGLFVINGERKKHYIFRQNYYYLLNDHQGYLDDSRTFGLIPEELLIGKACLLIFSPSDKRFMQVL
jgi:signal peptidase I